MRRSTKILSTLKWDSIKLWKRNGIHIWNRIESFRHYSRNSFKRIPYLSVTSQYTIIDSSNNYASNKGSIFPPTFAAYMAAKAGTAQAAKAIHPSPNRTTNF